VTLPYDQGPMLASPGKNPDAVLAQLLTGGRHVFDLKWDGVRVLAFIQDGQVTLKNRNGVNTTDRFPEVVERLAALYPTGTRVFDGEMLCFDPDSGKPTFARISRRDRTGTPSKIEALAKSMPATYMVFDLLWFDGDDLRIQPLSARLALLKVDAARFRSDDDARVALSMLSDDGAAMWGVIKSQGMEGLIAKDKLAPYRGGRAPAWVKLKPVASVTCVVVGYTVGQGARAGKFGALEIGLLYDGNLKHWGEVGTGFTDKMLADLKPRVDAGEMLVIEVEVQNITPDGKPRFPSYKGLRTDQGILDCDAAQLASIPVC
jgi:bifunctional non-homologous end joining protein LigD